MGLGLKMNKPDMKELIPFFKKEFADHPLIRIAHKLIDMGYKSDDLLGNDSIICVPDFIQTAIANTMRDLERGQPIDIGPSYNWAINKS